MPFCPSCRYEYNANVTVCPDCNEKLVAQLPDKPSDDLSSLEQEYSDWIQLVRLTSIQLADMAIEALREKGIPVVKNSGVGHFGFTGQMGTDSFRPIDGGISLMVPREFVEDADKEGELVLGEAWVKGRMVDIG